MSSMVLKILSLHSTFTEEEPNQETKSRTRLLANSRLEKFSIFNRQIKYSNTLMTKHYLFKSSLSHFDRGENFVGNFQNKPKR